MDSNTELPDGTEVTFGNSLTIGERIVRRIKKLEAELGGPDVALEHGRIVCICGVVIAQCRCITHGHTIKTISPCTHKRVAVGDHDPNRAKARYILRESDTDIETVTSDGLAFSIGVAVSECFLKRDANHFIQVCHPNGMVLYHVMWTKGTESVSVVKVA